VLRPNGWIGVELRHFLALDGVASEASFNRAAAKLGYVLTPDRTGTFRPAQPTDGLVVPVLATAGGAARPGGGGAPGGGASGVGIQADAEPPAIVSEGSLMFKEHLERLSEVILILLVGGMLFIDSWSWRAVGFAFFLFLVARPVSVMLGMSGSGALWRMRGLTGWFGVHGIGSLYYLMYAIQHDLPAPMALQFIQITLVVIALSIVVHGTSVKPLMHIFWRRKRLS